MTLAWILALYLKLASEAIIPLHSEQHKSAKDGPADTNIWNAEMKSVNGDDSQSFVRSLGIPPTRSPNMSTQG